MSKGKHKVYLALGSNLGNRLENLRSAVAGLRPYVSGIEYSRIYETAPIYVTDQPSFLNAVISGFTDLDPMMLLHTVKDIERQVGRMPTFRYGPRIVDIDIIFYGNQKIEHPELIVPHPRLAERAFVLCPLADIASDYVNSVNGKTVKQMLAELSNQGECVPTEDGF